MTDLVPIVEDELVEDPSGYGSQEPEYVRVRGGWVLASALRGDPKNVTGTAEPKVAGRSRRSERPAATLDLSSIARLSRTARTVLAELDRLAGGVPYEGGYAEIVQATGRPLRTIERAVAQLVAAGIVSVSRYDRTAPARLSVHPDAAVLAAAVAGTPHRVRDRVAPALQRLDDRANAVRCAAVRRPDGTRYLPIAYVAALLTERERAACAYAVAAGLRIVCDDAGLADELTAYFQRQAQRERFRASELAWAALHREARMRDDIPAYIDDSNDSEAA